MPQWIPRVSSLTISPWNSNWFKKWGTLKFKKYQFDAFSGVTSWSFRTHDKAINKRVFKKGPKSGRQQLLSLTHLKWITYWFRWHQCPKYQTPKASCLVPLPAKQDLELFRNQTVLYQRQERLLEFSSILFIFWIHNYWSGIVFSDQFGT